MPAVEPYPATVLAPADGGESHPDTASSQAAGGGYRSCWLRANGLRIHCLAGGPESGRPVVLLHGAGIDEGGFAWRDTLTPLAERFRVYAPDWPGQGASDRPDTTYDFAFYLATLRGILDALVLDRAALVGLSLGGAAALGLALASPERVDRLVLVGSYGLGRDIPFGRLGYLFTVTPFVNEVAWWLLRRRRDATYGSLRGVVHDPSVLDAALVDHAWRLLQAPHAGRAFRSFQRREVRPNRLRTSFEDRLAEVACPTLLIHGEQDHTVPVAWSRRSVELLPNGRLCVLPNCGHLVPREQPAAFNQALLAFLDADA